MGKSKVAHFLAHPVYLLERVNSCIIVSLTKLFLTFNCILSYPCFIPAKQLQPYTH